MRSAREHSIFRGFLVPATMVLLSLVRFEAPAAEKTGPGEGALEERALRLIEEGSPREAIDLLRGKTDTEERSLLLARAYLEDGNDFWAMRTLQELVQRSEDCGPMLWLVYAFVRQGALDEGRDLLEDADCRDGSALEVRRRILDALIATTEERTEDASLALRAAARMERAFPEDVRAIRALRPSVEEDYVTPITGRLELNSGWTSNALSGSPIDPAATEGPPRSALGQLSGSARVTFPTEIRPRPILEAEMRGLGLGADRGRDLSYLQLSARPGLLFLDGRALVGYRLETLGILGGDQFGDGPIWFYQAHRAELDVDPLPWLTVFGGAGHRLFRESRRSRIEADLGIGVVHRPMPSLSILGAVTGRHHKARRDFYDLFGATAIIQANWTLPPGYTARLGLMGSIDDYPRSEDFFVVGAARRDLLGKLTAGIFSPRMANGLRLGLTYELSHRMSTAPDYEYDDHRILLRAQLPFSSDPRGPRPHLPSGHVPLEWGLEEEDGALEETIQELLRQDEAVRAGSSCID